MLSREGEAHGSQTVFSKRCFQISHLVLRQKTTPSEGQRMPENTRAAAQIIYLNSCQSRFSGVYLVLKVLRDIWPSTKVRKILVYAGTLPCPALHGLKLCKFVSRSDLVLDADQSLDLLSDLAFQACISFCSVLDKSGA